MSYEVTDNDTLMASMRGGLYEANELSKEKLDDIHQSMFKQMIRTMNYLEKNVVSFQMIGGKIIDSATGICMAERNKDGKWIIVDGWMESLNNA